jgi:hypothetical protein
MKRNKMLLFLAAHRYEYLDEDSPDPEESDPPDRGPSLSASPPATPTSPDRGPSLSASSPATPRARDFRLSLETVWFFRVLLLFSFETETDTEIKRHECALVSLLWEYDEGRPGEKYILSLLNTSKFFYICVFVSKIY